MVLRRSTISGCKGGREVLAEVPAEVLAEVLADAEGRSGGGDDVA